LDPRQKPGWQLPQLFADAYRDIALSVSSPAGSLRFRRILPPRSLRRSLDVPRDQFLSGGEAWRGLADVREEDLSAADLALLDRAAELACGDAPEWEPVRQLYESDERLRVPSVIRSCTDVGVQEVLLPELEHASGS